MAEELALMDIESSIRQRLYKLPDVNRNVASIAAEKAVEMLYPVLRAIEAIALLACEDAEPLSGDGGPTACRPDTETEALCPPCRARRGLKIMATDAEIEYERIWFGT